MSNHTNYNRMYNSEEQNPVTEETQVVNEIELENTIEPEMAPEIEYTEAPPTDVENTVEAEPTDTIETVTGEVVNCTRLNVRKNPDANAKVLCVVRASEAVEVVVDDDLIDWYHVHTASGVDGYCMAQYIQI